MTAVGQQPEGNARGVGETPAHCRRDDGVPIAVDHEGAAARRIEAARVQIRSIGCVRTQEGGNGIAFEVEFLRQDEIGDRCERDAARGIAGC